MTLFCNNLLWLSFGLIAVVEKSFCASPLVLEDFEGQALPLNQAGELYPSQYTGEGGVAKVILKNEDSVFQKTIDFEITAGYLYAQFNAHNTANTRGFARENIFDKTKWKFNTINRLSFWMKNPANGSPLRTDGNASLQFGTYVKRVDNPDIFSDETGGGHYYHHANIPNTDTWTKVTINAHPSHFRGALGSVDQGNQLHPTQEAGYNYFDALTRFYINEVVQKAGSSPIVYQFDNFEFYQEAYPENDDQVYTLASTFVPKENRIIMTWLRPKDENTVKHEVRYSMSNIHEIGWQAATPAPDGIITPPGWQGYNGMVYNTTALNLHGTVYFAIKPQNSNLFTQTSITIGAASLSIAPQFKKSKLTRIELNPEGRVLKSIGNHLMVADLTGRVLFSGIRLGNEAPTDVHPIFEGR